ncbi:MAG: hypothetical protein JWM62_2560 [Frankiales bacterium]|nr:hypothetical protein [Frankiales bacterium]
MSIGTAARRTLGPLFPLAGRAYRRVFVDVRKVAAAVPELPHGAVLLDVGGGDGEILNHLLDRQPGLRIVALDLAAVIGTALRPDLRPRVDLRPGTSVRAYLDAGGEAADAVLLSDVFHHVPPVDREQLVRDVLDAFGGNPPLLVVKDIVPAGVRSGLAFWADRNISGDRGVQAIGPAELTDLVCGVRPDLVVSPTGLLDVDAPNYCLVFRPRAQP